MQWQITQMEMALRFNASRGALVPESLEHQYSLLAEQFWTTEEFWIAKQTIRSLDSEAPENYRQTVWNVLKSYFTDMGSREFRQLSGTAL